MSSHTLNTVEEELSLAYLHAVCARAGVTCSEARRALDNDGIDAMLKARFSQAQYPQMEDVHLEVQMKATKRQQADDGVKLSYWLKSVERYDVLRRENRQLARVLIVLFLPADPEEWLLHSEDELILRRCAYWASLRGAPAASSGTGATIKLPKVQHLSPANLQALMANLSNGHIPQFQSECSGESKIESEVS